MPFESERLVAVMPAAGKVTVGLTSDWPCIKDFRGLYICGLTAFGREMSTLPTLLMGYDRFYLIDLVSNNNFLFGFAVHIVELFCFSIIIIIIIHNYDDGTVILAQSHCESLPGSLDEYRLSARWLPTLRPSQTIWAVSPPVSCYHPHPLLPFYYYSAKADTHFAIPRRVEGWVNLECLSSLRT